MTGFVEPLSFANNLFSLLLVTVMEYNALYQSLHAYLFISLLRKGHTWSVATDISRILLAKLQNFLQHGKKIFSSSEFILSPSYFYTALL